MQSFIKQRYEAYFASFILIAWYTLMRIFQSVKYKHD